MVSISYSFVVWRLSVSFLLVEVEEIKQKSSRLSLFWVVLPEEEELNLRLGSSLFLTSRY
jgi:hypothetical protein